MSRARDERKRQSSRFDGLGNWDDGGRDGFRIVFRRDYGRSEIFFFFFWMRFLVFSFCSRLWRNWEGGQADRRLIPSGIPWNWIRVKS